MYQDDALYDAALSLANIYSADLSSSFPSQLLSFREVLRSEISKLDTVKDSAEILIIKHPPIVTIIPDISTVLKYF